MTFIEREIERLEEKEKVEGLDADESESLCEYKGRLESIEAERDFLNGRDEPSGEFE